MATVTIRIANFVYDPATATVSVGDSVVWENGDVMAHTATRTDDPAFDTGFLAQNATSAPVTFSEASKGDGFEYFCTPHPFMRGRIVVV
jgi:plastocyanin